MTHTAQTLTPEQSAKLERIRLYRTRYEVTATKDGRKVLVGYTPRKGRPGLCSMLSHNGAAWVKFSGDERYYCEKRASDGLTSGGWRINFSGRTQRECILAGELPFFVDLVSAYPK